MTDRTSTKKIVMASDCSQIGTVQHKIISEIEEKFETCAKKTLFSVRLALEEALANAVHHGNCDQPDCSVTIEYAIAGKQLTVSITDQGKGFSPDDLADPTLKDNLDNPHGRGVLLIKSYMDEVTFNKAGNTVTMVKKLVD